MSLEAKIEALTVAVEKLIAVLTETSQAPLPVTLTSVAAQPTPTPVAPSPVAPVATPVAAPVVPITAAMPAVPDFTTAATATVAPAPVAPAVAVPFSDQNGLVQYVMNAYRALGPQKGSQIQQVMAGLGYNNINDIKPEAYAALVKGIEALKS